LSGYEFRCYQNRYFSAGGVESYLFGLELAIIMVLHCHHKRRQANWPSQHPLLTHKPVYNTSLNNPPGRNFSYLWRKF